LKNGVIKSADQFRDLTRMTFLDDVDFATIWDHLQKGNLATAKDLNAERVLSAVLGSFKAENKPKLFTGYFGKLFGTFGVYSASTVDFYRRVLTNGSVKDRLATAARIAFTTTMLTNGFRAMGVDYSGFGLTDTLGFNGGPTWASIIDLSRASGNSPEAAVSRQNLLRNYSTYIPGKGFNVPRLAFPGANQINYMAKGFSDLLQGNSGALQELVGAPALQEPFTWKWY